MKTLHPQPNSIKSSLQNSIILADSALLYEMTRRKFFQNFPLKNAILGVSFLFLVRMIEPLNILMSSLSIELMTPLVADFNQIAIDSGVFIFVFSIVLLLLLKVFDNGNQHINNLLKIECI